MRFSEYCDVMENTEQEQQLLQFFKQDDMKEVETAFAKVARVPFVGKLMVSLLAMSDYESIAEFRQTQHYDNLKDWNFNIDFNKKSLYITPNAEQKKTALKALAVVGIVITLVVLLRKFCCRKK